MLTVNKCLICQQNLLSAHAAVFAAFVAKRVWNQPPFPVPILECKMCRFAFAGTRFDQDEERRLYENYRGATYQSIRESCEPWYTASFNTHLSTGMMEKRRRPLAEIFRQYLPSRIRSVLDFGGDRGDLFDGLIPGATTYVYDISGIQPTDGVTALSNLEECSAHKFDFVGCSNVLEHVASPRGLLSDIRAIASPKTLVFVEVPTETPFGMRNYLKRTAQQAILLIKRPAIAAPMFPLRFLRQVHEHVNFFTPYSLDRLLEVSGFEVLASGTYPSEGFSFGPYKLAAGRLAWSLGLIKSWEMTRKNA